MKNLIILLSSIILIFSTNYAQQHSIPTTKVVETGIDANSWVKIPAGDFFKGQHRHKTTIDKPYEIMVTDVTNKQYANYLNEAFAKGSIKVIADTVLGYYKGDPYDGFKHEFKITAGNKLYLYLKEQGIRILFDGKIFSVAPGFEEHPVTFITWFGANAYAEFYGWRLPLENEWEKAARGTDTRTFPWGEEVSYHIANYASSQSLREIFGKRVSTTPVGFYNGKNYDGYETEDNKSPYGLYDMGGNVWQWCGDDHPNVHYRYLRGGSHRNYEYNLFVWAKNSAGPSYYSMFFGFRCARDIEKVTDTEKTEESEEK
jgi:formylglycine-generating enzyme required for sulfatase activity